jgi:cytochrome c peroxidase
MGQAQCSTCHVPPTFTEPGFNMHPGSDIGIDDFQANRSPSGMYRTTPLKGLWTHQEGGFYHDGRFPKLRSVVQHYNNTFDLGLTKAQQLDLVQYLKSL